MMTDKLRELARALLDTFGNGPQATSITEESCELGKAAAKLRRHLDMRSRCELDEMIPDHLLDDLAEEGADVQLQLAQVRELVGEGRWRKALTRTMERAWKLRDDEVAHAEKRGTPTREMARARRVLDGLTSDNLAAVLKLYSLDRPTVVFLPGESKP